MRTSKLFLFLATILVASCSYSSKEIPISITQTSLLERQLKTAMAHTKAQNELYLMEAIKTSTLNTAIDVSTIIDSILSDDAYCISIRENGLFRMSTIGELNIDKGANSCVLKKKIHSNMDVYTLRWNFCGDEYESIAIGADETGIAYDNIGYRALSFVDSVPEEGFQIPELDTLAIDPDIAGSDSCDVSDSNAGVFIKFADCIDRFGLCHGNVLLACRVEFNDRTISSVMFTNNIYKIENDPWTINADIVTLNGGTDYSSITLAWYYSLDAIGYNAQLSPNGFLLPSQYIGESGVNSIDRPGINY